MTYSGSMISTNHKFTLEAPHDESGHIGFGRTRVVYCDCTVRAMVEVGQDARVAKRRTDEGEQLVTIQSAKDGMPMPPGSDIADVDGECRDGWHTATSLYKNGSAQVTTPEYRDGWERIFGGKQNVGVA